MSRRYTPRGRAFRPLLPARKPAALAVSLTWAGCGFVGFEASPMRDAGPRPPIATPDADVVDLDATTGPEAGAVDPDPRDAAAYDAASHDAGWDGSELDAGRDASAFDAGAPDANDGRDAAQDAAADPSDAGTDAGRATRVTDYCAQIPALPAPPVIDGVIDADLNLVNMDPEGWTSSGVANPGHTNVRIALAWRPEGIYAFVRVTDPNRLPPLEGAEIWEGDGVELYVDDDGSYLASPSYDDPGTAQIIVAAPEEGASESRRAVRFRDTRNLGPWTATTFAAFATTSGYVVEALMTAEALDLTSWILTTGASVGIDLGVNASAVGDELDGGAPLSGYRIGQYFLSAGGTSCGGYPFCTTEAFCNPTLIP